MTELQTESQPVVSLPRSPTERWSILVACCLASSARFLQPPLWIFRPPDVQPFDAAWNDFRLISSVSGILLIVFLLVGGVLGDLYGRRRFWLIGLIGFAASNLLLLISPSPGWHLTLRFCSLVFGSLFAPLILATLNITFTDRSRPIAFASFTVVNAIAIQVAWLQGQFLIEWWGWRAAFILPIALTFVAYRWAVRYVPESRAGGQRQFDLWIFSGWTLLILAVVYGVLVIPVASDFWWLVVGAALLVGITGAALIYWWDMRITKMLLRRRSFRTRELAALIITGAVINFMLIGFGMRTMNLFQVVYSMSAVVAVIALAPMLVGLLAAVYLFLRAMRQYQARAIVAGGLVVMAVAMSGAALLPVYAPYWLFILPLFLFGVGYLVASTIWTSAFLRTAVAQHYGVNAAINSATSTIGLAVGSALTGSLLARLGLELYRERVGAANLTVAELLEVATSLQALMLAEPADVAVISEHLHFDLLAGYQEVYAIAYSQVLWLMVVFCFITALIIGFGLRRSLKATLPHEEELSAV